MEHDLRLECLRLAAQTAHPSSIVQEATRYWDFVKGQSREAPERTEQQQLDIPHV